MILFQPLILKIPEKRPLAETCASELFLSAVLFQKTHMWFNSTAGLKGRHVHNFSPSFPPSSPVSAKALGQDPEMAHSIIPKVFG